MVEDDIFVTSEVMRLLAHLYLQKFILMIVIPVLLNVSQGLNLQWLLWIVLFSLWNFLSIIHQVVSDFSSFSKCLEIYSESTIPLSEFVACPTTHPTCSIFVLEVMLKVSTTLRLHVDITRQLANDNDNNKFSACSYSILQDFEVEIEVMIWWRKRTVQIWQV